MLAYSFTPGAATGALDKDVHLQASSLHELIDFMANELPRWRDRPGRPPETAETVLTSQLCAHLNSASRHSAGWDILQFRVEERDEQNKIRKIDLIPAASGVTIWIQGRGYTDFDALLPIECKRLPTPTGKDRDEREYIFSRTSSTGGIQRFKASDHGAAHALGVMIGYVQEDPATCWHERIACWIGELATLGEPGWTAADLLQLECTDETQRLTTLRSSHERNNGRTKIELRHLWVEMN